jgi:hypothetical protein
MFGVDESDVLLMCTHYFGQLGAATLNIIS